MSGMVSSFSGGLTSLERILFLSIAVLLLSVLLLLCYAVILRMAFNRRNAYRERRIREWEPVILRYMDGDAAGPERFGLKKKDWLIFGDFVNGYLENLEGAEHERLLELLREVRFDRFLMDAVRSGDRWKRVYALQYLGRMKHQPARALLEKMLEDSSPLIALSAFDALRMLGDSGNSERIIRTILQRNDLSSPSVSTILARFDDGVNPVLIRLLRDEALPETGKRLIVDIIADKRMTEAAPSLVRLLETGCVEELAIGCVKAIGILETPDALPVVTGSLSSPHWVVRSQAAKALGLIGGKPEISLLTDMLRSDCNFWVRLYSVQSLLRFGAEGRAALECFRNGPESSPDIRGIIEYALAGGDEGEGQRHRGAEEKDG